MRGRSRQHGLFLMGVILLPTGGAHAQPAEEGTTRDASGIAEERIAIIETEPAKVAMLDHAGPYWSVGPVLQRVRQYARERGLTGPLFVRFHVDPARSGTVNLRADVGVILDTPHHPAPPFRLERWEAERVGRLVVRGRAANPWRDYLVIKQWLAEYGYEPAGPITEIYHAGAEAPSPRQWKTEIRVTLMAEADEDSPAAPGSILDGRDGISSPNEPTPEGPTALPDSPAASNRYQHGMADAVPNGDDETSGNERAGRAPATAPRETTKDTLVAPALPGRPRIQELLAQGEYDEAVELLLPPDRPLDPELAAWLGQVFYRLGAAAKGLRDRFPDEGRAATTLTTALTRRYERLLAEHAADPLAQTVVRVDVHANPRATQQREILRTVDRLLGEVAVKRLDARPAVEQMHQIIGRLHPVLHEPQPDSDELVLP